MSRTREQLREDRLALQSQLRPDSQIDRQGMAADYSDFAQKRGWPERALWHLKKTQGIQVEVIEPEKYRDGYNVVQRNKGKYSVTFGNGKETDFDVKASHFSIAAGTVSGSHCTLHFTKTKEGGTHVEIEDNNSLNGTFIIRRPVAGCVWRPFLEKEVRGERVPLEGIEFLRLGPVCVLAISATNIYYDDEPPEEPEPTLPEGSDEVEAMLKDGWYFPRVVKMPE